MNEGKPTWKSMLKMEDDIFSYTAMRYKFQIWALFSNKSILKIDKHVYFYMLVQGVCIIISGEYIKLLTLHIKEWITK